ncbi:hypothetical protein bcgnr5390_10400 [Bacillus luti]|nr:hypothetical protein BC2903_30510 [Bacillus cereus]
MYNLIDQAGKEIGTDIYIYNWASKYKHIQLKDMNLIEYLGLIKYVQNWYWERADSNTDAIKDFGLLSVTPIREFGISPENSSVDMYSDIKLKFIPNSFSDYLNGMFEEDIRDYTITTMRINNSHMLILLDSQGNEHISKRELENVELLGLVEYALAWQEFGYRTEWNDITFIDPKIVKNARFKGKITEEYDETTAESKIVGFSLLEDMCPAIVLKDKRGKLSYHDFY